MYAFLLCVVFFPIPCVLCLCFCLSHSVCVWPSACLCLDPTRISRRPTPSHFSFSLPSPFLSFIFSFSFLAYFLFQKWRFWDLRCSFTLGSCPVLPVLWTVFRACFFFHFPFTVFARLFLATSFGIHCCCCLWDANSLFAFLLLLTSLSSTYIHFPYSLHLWAYFVYRSLGKEVQDKRKQKGREREWRSERRERKGERNSWKKYREREREKGKGRKEKKLWSRRIVKYGENSYYWRCKRKREREKETIGKNTGVCAHDRSTEYSFSPCLVSFSNIAIER